MLQYVMRRLLVFWVKNFRKRCPNYVPQRVSITWTYNFIWLFWTQTHLLTIRYRHIKVYDNCSNWRYFVPQVLRRWGLETQDDLPIPPPIIPRGRHEMSCCLFLSEVSKLTTQQTLVSRAALLANCEIHATCFQNAIRSC